VFSANGVTGTQLYLRALDTLSSQPLPGTESAVFPFWSPDSHSIAFFTNEKLKRIDLGGNAPITICDSVLGRGGSWGPDGTIIAAMSYNAGISRVPATGGVPTLITAVDNLKYSSHRWPWFLPDGKHFLYLAINHNAPASPDTGVFVASVDGKENRLLFHNLSSAIYASGHLLFQRENSLLAQGFDPSAAKFIGEPETMSENVQYDAGLWRANLSTSTDGSLLYASGATSGIETLTWFDRTGKIVGTVGEQGSFYDIDLSPDEKKLAVSEANTANATIWILDLESKLKTRLTFSPGTHRSPVWSPDGKEIAFTSNQQTEISVKTIAGTEPERTLVSSPTPLFQGISGWSPDGRYLMFEEGPGVFGQLWVVPMFGGQKPFPYTKASNQERDGSFSPDGRWVAYMSNETGRPEIFVAPFPWTGAKWQVSNGGGADARWRADGKELYYFDFTGIAAVEVDGTGSEFKVGGSKPLFHLAARGLTREYSPTHDGQRFIAIAPSEGASQSLTLVQNWPTELKRK